MMSNNKVMPSKLELLRTAFLNSRYDSLFLAALGVLPPPPLPPESPIAAGMQIASRYVKA